MSRKILALTEEKFIDTLPMLDDISCADFVFASHWALKQAKNRDGHPDLRLNRIQKIWFYFFVLFFFD